MTARRHEWNDAWWNVINGWILGVEGDPGRSGEDNTTPPKHRDQIERFFDCIKRCRRIATRYEKKPANFAGFLWLAPLITDLI